MVLLSILSAFSAPPISGRLILNVVALTILLVTASIAARLAYHIFLAQRTTWGLQRIGIWNSSHLVDQHNPRYGNTGTICVKAIRIHPIKSCKPIELEQARLVKTGFEYDRWFALATSGQDGQWQFCSQRTRPLMALVHQEIWLPNTEFVSTTSEPVKGAGKLIVRFPDCVDSSTIHKVQTWIETRGEFRQSMATIAIPLHLSNTEIEHWGLKYRDFSMHGQKTSGIDLSGMPDVASALPKLQQFLGIPRSQQLTLLQCTPAVLRRTDTNLAPLRHIGTPSLFSYTDEQPIHIINLPSVHETSTYLPAECQPLDARRFRPNIFLTGAPAFSEETWKRFRVTSPSVRGSLTTTTNAPAHSTATLSVVCRTGRCTMPSVNPDTGVPDYDQPPAGRKKGRLQPTMTLKEYRDVEANNNTALGFLGMHCVPEDNDLQDGGGPWIRVGDEIEVLETGEHLTGSTAGEY